MRVGILGSTGVLGRQVVPRLLERGHLVRALVRHEAQPGDPPTPWPSFRVSNARARQVLGWQPRLRTYRCRFI